MKDLTVHKDHNKNKYSNINQIIDPNYYDNISYEPSVWFTLNKKVNSGLHNDSAPTLIYMIEGKKTIYLFAPNSYSNLYISEFPLLQTL